MGLDTTHDCWHGSYSNFMRWRRAVAKAAGFPPLDSMIGFGGHVSWDPHKDDPLTVLLHHSDCEGEIATADCGPLADRLEQLLPLLSDDGLGDWHDRGRASRFIAGLRLAAAAGENVEFH